MKRVVYFLGAGFSAPAGLPIISNFLFQAHDQFSRSSEDYRHFQSVFRYIDGLSKAKNFINIDLFNVEEVFSIADTHELLGKGLKKDFEQFIKDVIKYRTPAFRRSKTFFIPSANIFEVLFGDDAIQRKYVSFIAALLNLIFYREDPDSKKERYSSSDFIASVNDKSEAEYKIITLNYDTILENCVHYLNINFSCQFSIELAKLHGSVDRRIVPPTWNKNISQGLEEDWIKAAKWLSEANEIRILGYSLPVTDIYIKHLLSTAFVESSNLQKIDAICLDHDKSVEARYKSTFTFPRFNFFNYDISSYLDIASGRTLSTDKTTPLKLEQNHESRVS